MKLETYAKIAIVFGITVSCILVGIVLSYSISDVFNIYDMRQDVAWILLDKEEIKQQMMNSTSYIFFIDRFPDYREKITEQKDNFSIKLEDFNPVTMNVLRMSLSYNMYSSSIEENVSCSSINQNVRPIESIYTLFIDTFITETKCLDDDFKLPSFADRYRDGFYD